MKNWIWYVLGGLFFALAGGGVLYGVLTHREAGLLPVCWVDGNAQYTEGCKSLRWEKAQLPLTYYIDFGPDHEAYVKSVVAAADMWNHEIGPVFKRVNNALGSRIRVSWGAYSGGHDCVAGYVQHKGHNSPEGADLVLKSPSDTHAVFRYAAHEFGHVLGLAHDAHGLMIPSLEAATTELKFTLPSDHDKKLLRGLYR